MGIDKEKTTNKNMRTPSDWMVKAQVKLNYDLSKRFYLSTGVGFNWEKIAITWRKPFYPYPSGKYFPRFFTRNLNPYLFIPFTTGYKILAKKKYTLSVETGLMASLSGGFYDKIIQKLGQGRGYSYQEGDSTFSFCWNSTINWKSPIAINMLFKIGLSFTTKHESVFDIHLLASRGFLKTTIVQVNYYEKINPNFPCYQVPYTNIQPEGTSTFFSRGSQYGVGISYLINWIELKKNKKLEKQYENLQSK